MRHKIEKIRRRLKACPRLIAAPMFFMFMLAAIVPGTFSNDIMTVTDYTGRQQSLMTTSSSPEEILEQNNYASVSFQGVDYPSAEIDMNPMAVPLAAVVNRVFQIKLYCDGETHSLNAVTGTVGDLLEKNAVVLGPNDYVVPASDMEIKSDMDISIYRVEYLEESLRTDVKEEAVEEYRLALESSSPDTEFKASRSGIYDVSYRHTLINGEVSKSEILSLTAVVTPNDEANTEFVNGEACSSIDRIEGVEFDENNLPVNYSRKISNAVTTAYSSSGGRGSSGLGLYCGTVAVNPGVIPYGSKLYIVSPDGNFVYGYAIATDTGTALVDGRVDIDLYFESNSECYKFGKRALDVYVLE